MTTLLLVPLPPLLLAMLLAGRAPLRTLALRLAPWAALPALAWASRGASESRQISWLLFGAELGIDGLGRVLLLFTALVWTAAGVYARASVADDGHRVRYWVFHLLTLAGNLTLLVAGDVVTFYLGFALMTFAAYGLVVHTGTSEARRAGRVYLVMAVLGEGLLLAGLFLASAAAVGSLSLPDVAAAVAEAPHREVVVALLFLGFGVKAGALPLHVWLPLAHPVAPTPASAVLSGCMIKGGMLGWLRFLPIGAAALPEWGGLLVAAGLGAAFFGAIAGMAQDDAKTTLAYSSISQMGFLTIAVGIGLASPSAGPAAIAACAVYAAHHGLAKGALFLGAGVAAAAGTRRVHRTVVLSLLLPALALVGAPLTSGVLAKSALQEIEPFAPPLLLPLSWWLSAAAVGTTLVLARFLILVARKPLPDPARGPAAGLWLPYAGLLAMVAALGLFGAGAFDLPAPAVHSLADLTKAAGPILVGGLLAWLGSRLRLGTRIPPGDGVVVVERWLARIGRRGGPGHVPGPPAPVAPLAARWDGIYAARRPTRARRTGARAGSRRAGDATRRALVRHLRREPPDRSTAAFRDRADALGDGRVAAGPGGERALRDDVAGFLVNTSTLLRRLGSVLLRTLIFGVAFWIVAEGRIETPMLAAGVVLAATATSVALLPIGAFRVHGLGLLRFVPWFLRESVQGGVDVAGRACRPTLPLEPGFLEYRLRLPTPAARTIFTNAVSLLPGTLSVSLRDDRLRIHALDVGQPLPGRLRRLEERVGDLLGLRLPATESAGRRQESPVP